MRTSYHNHRGPSRQRRERKFQQVGRCSISFPKSMQLRLHYGQILFDSILTCASFLRHISFRFTFAINGLAIVALHNADFCKPLLPGRGALATRLRGGLFDKILQIFDNLFSKILTKQAPPRSRVANAPRPGKRGLQRSALCSATMASPLIAKVKRKEICRSAG